MALTRLGSLAATNLVLGGNVGTEGDAYKNYNTITSNATLTMEASKNYFLKGPITINNGVTFTIAGTGELRII
jgi:hypothetical protein